MTDTQLYLAIGLPTLAVVLGMILNGFLFNALSSRIGSVETRIGGVETGLSARMSSLESRMLSLDEHMYLMIGKIGDIDNRLSVLEDRTNRS